MSNQPYYIWSGAVIYTFNAIYSKNLTKENTMLSVIVYISCLAIVLFLTFAIIVATPARGVVPQKRTWLDALMGIPKEEFERGPRPPLVHPDVLKARKEKEEWLKSKQAEKNKIQVTIKYSE